MTEVEKVGEKKRLAQRMDAHWKYLSTFDTVEILVDPPIPTRGLGLPDSVLRKVYYLNAIRILKIDN
jgi:hypothetical protein